MRPRLYLSYLRRDSRGSRGRLAFFALCLAVGVAAVVAVAGLSASLEDGLRSEARQLLAADLKIESRRPAPPELAARLAQIPGVQTARVREMVTMASAPPPPGQVAGASQLVELKVVEGGYPFYGRVETEPGRPLSELLDGGSVVVAPDLLSRLQLKVGDDLQVGGATFRIAGVVLSEPDRLSLGLAFGPRVFLAGQDLERTRLLAPGSRVEHRILVRLPPDLAPEAGEELARSLRAELPEAYRVETYRQAQPALRRGLAQADRFLGLVALLSLLVGGIGVAQTVRAWIAGRLDAIATLRCLGWRPREVAALYMAQSFVLGLAGSVGGLAVGIAVQLALPWLLPDLVPARFVHPFQPAALLKGMGLGVGVALLFSLPPLATVWNVPPVRVLRRDADPLPTPRWARLAVGGTVAVGILALASLQSRSLWLGLQFAGGVALATLLLAACALTTARLVGRLPQSLRTRVWLRHGLAALARPGAATVGAIVALGLGVLVVLAMSLVEGRLSAQLASEVPEDAPTAFLIDIQPDQWPAVRQTLEQSGARQVESVPVVMARLSRIDGRGTDDLARELDPDAREPSPEDRRRSTRRWALTREQRLTYLEQLPADNTVVEGDLWNDPDLAEVSIEEDYARDLGVRLGSTLTLDIQGVAVELRVTSLRRVDWRSFGINFFLVVEPGVLESAPQQRLAVVRLAPDQEQPTQDLLAARFPNVTFLPLRQVLHRIVTVLERIGLGVSFLGGFTVVAGALILGGAVSAGSARRGHEVALLKTLGMTRGEVAALFAVEYALVGLVAGTIGVAGGGVLAWAVLSRGMEIPWTLDALPYAVALGLSLLLAVVAGLAASWRDLGRRPLDSLRQGS